MPAQVGVGLRAHAQRIEAFLVFACLLGLLVGWLHATRFLVLRVGLDRLTWETRDVPWMAPLSNGALMAILAGTLLPIVLWNPRSSLRLAAPSIVAATAVFCALLLHLPRVHPYASLVLALGAGLRIAQVHDREWPRWRRRYRIATLSMLAACAVPFLAIRGPFLRDHRPAGDAVTAPPDAPNVVVLLLDTVRAASLSLYGYARETTPRLEEIAARGVTFDRAVAPSSWTLPSHASLFTGYAPHALAADWRLPLDERFPTLGEHFQKRGYRTAGFVANNLYASEESGLARGFDEWFDFDVNLSQLFSTATILRIPVVSNVRWASDWRGRLAAVTRPGLRLEPSPPFPRKRASRLNDEFLAWQASELEAPFFAFFNYYDAHAPYRPPAPYDTLFSRSPSERDHYDGALAYLDTQIGRLVDSIDARRLRRPTLLIVTSDHGELFGENGRRGHGNGVFWRTVHVPLIVSFPGRIPAGVHIDEAVSLVDLPSTITDLAGNAGRLGGMSLTGTWTRPGARAKLPVISEFWQTRRKPPYTSVRALEVAVVSESLQVIMSAGSSPRTFNFVRDPRGTIQDSSDFAIAVQNTVRTALDSALQLRGPLDRTLSQLVSRR